MLLDDIYDLLSTGGTTASGFELRKGLMPEQPDQVVVVYETGGMAPDRAFRDTAGQPVAERPRIQIVARGSLYDYQTPRLKMNDIYSQLEGLDRTVNGVRYLWFGAVQSPFLMGRDSNSRPLIAMNFDIVKEMSTA